MSSLADLVRREAPAPWRDGDNIPWHEPGFSEGMLREHLSQEHDAASRRVEVVDAQVKWIHRRLLRGRPTKVLDLACGPGLYTSRLAARGHECVGIDYSPASITYASRLARREGLRCRYRRQDIRRARYGSGFGLVMLIFGELNSFRPSDARAVLRQANRALGERGVLLLEVHTARAVRAKGSRGHRWYSATRGLFSGKPHLCLQEHSWDARAKAATTRYFVIDASTGRFARYAATQQAYSDAEYRSLLGECGFRRVRFVASLTGETAGSQPGLFGITARK